MKDIFKDVAKQVAINLLTDVLKMSVQKFTNSDPQPAPEEDRTRVKQLLTDWWSLDIDYRHKLSLVAKKIDYLDQGVVSNREALWMIAGLHSWNEKGSKITIPSFESIVVDKERKVAVVHYQFAMEVNPSTGAEKGRLQKYAARHLAVVCDVSTAPKLCGLKKLGA